MSSEDFLDHGRRIAELERQVAELRRRLGEAEPTGFAPRSGFDGGFSEPTVSAADEDPRVLELIARGNKIGAIKLYRELTGFGLAEAKDAVERLGTLHGSRG